MKKKLIFIVLMLALFVAPLKLHAESEKVYIFDEAELLTADQETALNTFAETVSERYKCDVYVAFMHELHGNKDVAGLSEDLYEAYDLGYGSDRDCIMLTVSMAESVCEIYGHGMIAASYFTDSDRDWILDRVVPYLSNGDFVGAAEEFISKADYMLSTPLDSSDILPSPAPQPEPVNPMAKLAGKLGGSTIIAAIVSLFSTLIKKGKMKNTGVRTSANQYASGGVDYRTSHDYFVTSHRSVRHIEHTSSSSSSGGTRVHSGGSHVSSGGHSHSSSRHF